MADSNTSPPHFAGLPAELWAYITQLAVLLDNPVTFKFSTPKKTVQSLVRQPSILRTCCVLRAEGLAAYYRNNSFVVIGDTELPRALEGRTGAMPPSFQAWINAIGPESRAQMRSLYITHFASIPVRTGWVDHSIIRYVPIRPTYEIFEPYAREMDESGFVFRPYTVKVEFETRRIQLVDITREVESL
ncbi:uncharacterized protein LTR77_001400 [Saxophila tyrrhenica]|uniref:Uncharacterized protein n=1 Tax=Saxophila tyrrhenica TaxID=1690608 RepID=A0AAV9PL01_9PEZI|nr:hypothetical protein LTR77_001400 [Saxophila tyrrhenica]